MLKCISKSHVQINRIHGKWDCIKIFFENIIHFLQDNGFTTKEILKKGEKPTDNTEIKNRELTEEGLTFYLYGIRKWRQKYDRAKDGMKAINDFAFIEKKLKEFRSKNIANNAG